MDVLIRMVGLVLVLVPVVDLFFELFQVPRGRALSTLLARVLWVLLKWPARRSRVIAESSGPLIMVGIITTWVAMSVIGWALMIYPSITAGEVAAMSPHVTPASDFFEAIYLSLVTLSTLGFGDVIPTEGWIRIVLPIEALFGLGLAGGTISWLLSVHPMIRHRTNLATKVGLLHAAEEQLGQPFEEVSEAHQTFRSLTHDLSAVHSDLRRFPLSYYFFVGEAHHSLPANMHYLIDVAERARESSGHAAARVSAVMLITEADRLLATIARRFLRLPPDAGTTSIIEAWQRDHDSRHIASTGS